MASLVIIVQLVVASPCVLSLDDNIIGFIRYRAVRRGNQPAYEILEHLIGIAVCPVVVELISGDRRALEFRGAGCS